MTDATLDDRAFVRAYFDRFGDAEWDRLAKDLPGRVPFEIGA